MNRIEFCLMNNPIRGFIQDKIEIKRLRKMSDLEKGTKVLEIGCGNGRGTELITKYFSPSYIEAIDLDPKMIEYAQKRNKNSSVHFQVGDAAQLPFASDTFDAIFDFGIIHHIPNWHDCLKELYRVLKPGGQLILEDLSIETFSTPLGRLLRKFLVHPYNEMFNHDEFVEHLKKLGFTIKEHKRYNPGIKYFAIVVKK